MGQRARSCRHSPTAATSSTRAGMVPALRPFRALDGQVATVMGRISRMKTDFASPFWHGPGLSMRAGFLKVGYPSPLIWGTLVSAAGQLYLDACFGSQERWRLEAVERAKGDPESPWYALEVARLSRVRAARNTDIEGAGRRRRSRTRTCDGCGGLLGGRERRWCSDRCRKRAKREAA
jgi:hypothetical protein